MTLETQYKKFLKDNPNSNLPFEEWMKVHSRLLEQALINMMKADEELGLYDEPFKHKVETIPAEEILANRCNAYDFIDFDKQETKELNPYIEPFLLRNGFKKQENSSYDNLECTVTVLDGYYKIDWNHIEYGELSTYTDSYSITHLVGILTWHDLIDRNYKK